ncbi:MAG: TrpB-like pyridoxal phosphate-dependent enzyme [Dysgonamonadaceae bacterium]|jgi:tryptophan synthase beta chain|nr:TrpB-like pyridoxal phosphate-dependent enzyme [Dysgonamonadaceae bacterium]
MATKKILLSEKDIPLAWYNIVADMENKPLPPLHPATKKPLNPSDLEQIFPKAIIEQEMSAERWIEIPDEVRELYKIWRPTPLVRASGLEKALDTPAHIYFKNEGISPVGSHKLNSAIPQVFYNKQQGITHLTTETGAGQWGTALAFACNLFGITLEVFMVKVSYNQKPYRRVMMQTWNADVIASPSNTTDAGKSILNRDPNNSGSLGIAISEAIEKAVKTPNTKYSLGSVLNHVALHQTVIGLEAEKQLEIAGEFPDIVIGCFGGGSNFSGIGFPFLRHNLVNGKKIRIIAAEPESCPKLTRGKFEYDFGDTVGMTPLLPMYTLGHDFQPADIHAGGLRYHGAGTIVSQLRKDNLIEVEDIPQLETFEAGRLFARTEGTIPAPESAHAIASAIREAKKAKEEGIAKTILFNLSGHGLIDMSAYEQFLGGEMKNYQLTDDEINKTVKSLENLIP